MRIFFICQRVPYPPDRGDKITTFNEIRHLSKEHEIHVFCIADGQRDLANISGLSAYVKSVTAVPVSLWGSRFRALKALFQGASLSVAAYNQESLHAAIKRKYRELKPDLIFAYSCNVAQYAEHFLEKPRIVQFADLDSLKWDQYAARSAPPMKWIYAIEHSRLLTYERKVAHSFCHSLVCTNAELGDFERAIPNVPVSVVGNGVDFDYFQRIEGKKKRACMIFTGVMDYFPNIDAVVWFCEEVLPLIQREIPEASFVICGSRPTPAVLRLAREGVTVTGQVSDTRPYLDAAEISVVPLRMARGLQNKILEALAMELPCVSSIRAWSGTVIPRGEGILATDDPKEFARYCIQLLEDHHYRNEMARKGRAAVAAKYKWDAQMHALDDVISTVIFQWEQRVLRPL